MDPLTGFVTIVSLFGTFKNERRDRDEADLEGFKNWLSDRRQNEVVDLLDKNNDALKAITDLLDESHENIIEKLENFENMFFLLVTTRGDAFSDLAKAIHPEAGLSNQALSILKQMHSKGEKCLNCIKYQGQTTLSCSTSGNFIEINEQAHLDEDLNQLKVRDLLKQRNSSYTITRLGIIIAENARQL